MRLSVPKVCNACGKPILTTRELDSHDLYCQGYGFDGDDWYDDHLEDQELRKREP